MLEILNPNAEVEVFLSIGPTNKSHWVVNCTEWCRSHDTLRSCNGDWHTGDMSTCLAPPACNFPISRVILMNSIHSGLQGFFFPLKIKKCARLTAHILSFFCTVGKSLFKTEIINISIASTWSCSTRSSFNLFIKDSGKWLGSHTIKADTIVFPKYFAFDTKWKYGEQRLWRMGSTL